MKTEYQILQELTRLENLNVNPEVDYLTRISALKWVLDAGEVGNVAQEELIMKCTRECRFKDVVNFDCCNCCDVENCAGRCEDNYNTCEGKTCV